MTPITEKIERVRLAESAVVRAADEWYYGGMWNDHPLAQAVKDLYAARAGLDHNTPIAD